ncbi:hypothetical protein EDD22DRAFT_1021227 [Suillus occidentalis]|nr:hypothetical protein EDD22DRAFT_1021227 [Suillus occidentalis]
MTHEKLLKVEKPHRVHQLQSEANTMIMISSNRIQLWLQFDVAGQSSLSSCGSLAARTPGVPDQRRGMDVAAYRIGTEQLPLALRRFIGSSFWTLYLFAVKEFSQANNGDCDLYEGRGLRWQAGQKAAIHIRSVQLEVTDVFLSKCYVCPRKTGSSEDIVEIPRHSLSSSQRAQGLLSRWRLRGLRPHLEESRAARNIDIESQARQM